MRIKERIRNSFICPEPEGWKREEWRASYLRRQICLKKKVAFARLYATACGIYRIYLNGLQVRPEALFAPGFTNYHARLQVQTYDVNEFLNTGENVLGVLLCNGWYRGWSGCTGGMGKNFPVWGNECMFAAVLRVRYEDGEEAWFDTSESVKATQEGPLRENDMRGGERYDATMEMPGWSCVGFDDSTWHYAVRRGRYRGKLIDQEGLTISRHEEFAGKLIRTPKGETVIDFGQNLSGFVHFSVEGHAGETFSILHGETLDEDGNFTLKNLSSEKEPFGQVITYTMKDGPQEYEPMACYMGFRYICLRDYPGEVREEDFRAVAIYSDVEMNGEFSCSSEKINQLFSNVQWGLKSNFMDIPTDCPTREHSGWTGDAMIFCETANWIADCELFWKKWMRDVALQQGKDGKISCIAPDANPAFGEYINGSAGWGDAIEVIPTTGYRFYGDTEMIREFYPNVCRWISLNIKRAKKNNIKSFKNIFSLGKDRKYILDTGYHWGEWKEPDIDLGNGAKIHLNCTYFPDAEVATACFAHAALLASEMAEILGKTEDRERFRKLFVHIRRAYRKMFLSGGLPRERTRQCRYVRPLAYHLVEGEQRERLAEELAKVIRENHYHIGTGFLTTGLILSALSENGQLETAYRLLENEEFPGWLYCVNRGATTTWENWNGIDEQGMPHDSLNHYSAGSVVAWFFREMCGIHLSRGKVVKIAPKPGGTLTFAKASYRTRQGWVRSGWYREQGKIRYEIEIPEGTTVWIYLNGKRRKVTEGSHTFVEKE